jgi:hypothetical protein
MPDRTEPESPEEGEDEAEGGSGGEVRIVEPPECWLKKKLATMISLFFILVTAGLLISEKIEAQPVTSNLLYLSE